MAIKGGPGPAASAHVTLQLCWVHCAGVAGRGCSSTHLTLSWDCTPTERAPDDHATTIYPCALEYVARTLARRALAGFWAYDRGSSLQERMLLRGPAYQRQSAPSDPCVALQRAHNAAQMTVTYQVGGGGHLDIDFWVRTSKLCCTRHSGTNPCSRSSRTRTTSRSEST